MNIQTILRDITPYNAETSYVEFAKVMENSYIKLSFWGGRNVYSIGYEGSIYLEDIAQRVIDLVNDHPEFSQEERKLGYSIEKKIWELYNITLDQEDKTNFITSFFLAVRYFFLKTVSDSIHDKVSNSQLFDYCTLKQYKDVTGNDPNPNNASSEFLEKPNKKLPIWFLPKEERNLFEYSPKA